MSRLTRDGTTEPVSREKNLRRERGKGNIKFPSLANPVDPQRRKKTLPPDLGMLKRSRCVLIFL